MEHFRLFHLKLKTSIKVFKRDCSILATATTDVAAFISSKKKMFYDEMKLELGENCQFKVTHLGGLFRTAVILSTESCMCVSLLM